MKLIFKIIVTIILFTGCKNEETYETYMNDVMQKHPYIVSGEWENNIKAENKDFKYYEQYLKQNDTIYAFNLEVYSKKHMEEFNPAEKYFVNFYKSYKDSLYWYQLNMLNFDTNYYYKYLINNKDERFYYIGKYRSLFNDRKLNPCEEKYYLKHRDSLDQIRGNDSKGSLCDEDII